MATPPQTRWRRVLEVVNAEEEVAFKRTLDLEPQFYSIFGSLAFCGVIAAVDAAALALELKSEVKPFLWQAADLRTVHFVLDLSAILLLLVAVGASMLRQNVKWLNALNWERLWTVTIIGVILLLFLGSGWHLPLIVGHRPQDTWHVDPRNCLLAPELPALVLSAGAGQFLPVRYQTSWLIPAATTACCTAAAVLATSAAAAPSSSFAPLAELAAVVALSLLCHVSNKQRDIAGRFQWRESRASPAAPPPTQARSSVGAAGRGSFKHVTINENTPAEEEQANRSNSSSYGRVISDGGAPVSAVGSIGSMNSIPGHTRRNRLRVASIKDGQPQDYVQVVPIAEDSELVHVASLPGSVVLEDERSAAERGSGHRVLSNNSIFSYKLSDDGESCNFSQLSLPVLRDAEIQTQKDLLGSKDAQVETTLVWAVDGFRCTACSKPPLMPGTVLPNPAIVRPPRRHRSRTRSDSRAQSVDSSRSSSPTPCRSSPSQSRIQSVPTRPSEGDDFDGLWVLQTPDPATVADWSRWVYIKGRIGVDARGQRFELREDGMHWVLWKGPLSRAGAILHRDGTGGKRMTYMLSPPAPMPPDVPETASRLYNAYNSNTPEQPRISTT